MINWTLYNGALTDLLEGLSLGQLLGVQQLLFQVDATLPGREIYIGFFTMNDVFSYMIVNIQLPTVDVLRGQNVS